MESEVITHYRENVIAINTLQRQLDWNRRHSLPDHDLPDQIRELKQLLIRFQDIVEEIPDRRTANIIRCRFALGMSTREISDCLELSKNTVLSYITDYLSSLDRQTGGHDPADV